MAAQLPYGAAEIVALRTAGKRPADLLLISLVGPLSGETNPAIVAKPGRSYDWRFLVGLDVLIVATTSTLYLASLAKEIETAGLASLSVWFADQQDGINVLIDGYRPQTKSGRRMGVAQRVTLAGLGTSESSSECLHRIAGEVKRRAMANADRFDAALVDMGTNGFRRTFGAAWGAAS